jgi:hypothetical protein
MDGRPVPVARSVALDRARAYISGPPYALRLGFWSAWGLVPLYAVYFAAVVVGGIATGVPHDPAWAVADIVTVIGAAIQVALFAVIHECAPPSARVYSRMALGWMLVMAALTSTVHFVQLTVTRRIDLVAEPALASVFWRTTELNLLSALELVSWHLFLGLALVCSAAAFPQRGGLETAVRATLGGAGALCLLGLLGPALASPSLRLIGVVGYGVVFPVACLLLGFVFRAALQRDTPETVTASA